MDEIERRKESDAQFLGVLYTLCASYTCTATTASPAMLKANNPERRVRTPEQQERLRAEMERCTAPCCKPQSKE